MVRGEARELDVGHIMDGLKCAAKEPNVFLKPHPQSSPSFALHLPGSQA